MHMHSNIVQTIIILCCCRIPERLVFIGSMVVMAMGFVVWLPYAGHPKIGKYTHTCTHTIRCLLPNSTC